jgi:predicted transcriptional regulator
MGGTVTAPTSFGKPKKSSSVKKRRTLFSVLGQITDRDMQLLLQLYEHKVLTTHQVYELHFSTHHRARKRLSLLYDRGILDRFRPPRRPGSYPHHYVLDDRGAKLVAGYLGAELKALKFRKDRLLRLSRSRYLRHLRDTNGFFTRLAYECRRAGDGTSLDLWLGERRSALPPVRPDGLGVLKDQAGEMSFWLEVDLGTETHERLEEKMERYARVSFFKDLPHAVLFCFHSEDRETRARGALFNPENYSVATTTLARHQADPLGPNWLPIRGGRRLSLLGFPRHHREGLGFDYDRDVLPGEDDTGW